MYLIRARGTGHFVAKNVASIGEAEQLIAQYEEEDKKDGVYSPNFYEIAFMEERKNG